MNCLFNNSFGKNILPVLVFALAPRTVVVNIRGDKRNDRGAFGIDHLLQLLAHLAPAAGFEQRGRRAGAVAHVGNGNLDGILVHRYLVTQNLGADNGVLGKVLGRAATDHKKTRLGAGHLDLSQLYKVAHRVDAQIRLAFLGALPLMLADAETCRAVAECGHKDRHTALVAGLKALSQACSSSSSIKVS